MSDYLDRALAYLEIERGQVIKHRREGDEYIVIANLGPMGVPKYRIPIGDLPEPEPEEGELAELDYRALQGIAKSYGIPANQSAEALADAIAEEEGFALAFADEEE